MTIKVICIAIGLLCISVATPQPYGIIPSFRGFPLNEPARWVIAFGGVIIILYNLFYKQSKDPSKIIFYENTICPKCETTFIKGSPVPDSICPKCKIQLEPLDGFYERHPSLKNVAEKRSEKKEDN
ncbi:hypothetical protein [Maridesulfovibrio ferrireducens]|uniref:hypothetical protein n=1 Tax=Maridesulfovibrio ferrireducens TaxID=246191 RepID=UPI001A1AE837|nr:hypothetical protein [Maridesulfovibrio ferrireducens]MBI9112830.1 hypothetical protein [Maridesulfovibrio ferrireducens]